MSLGHTVVLGALAGFTIFLGLPLGRLRRAGPRACAALIWGVGWGAAAIAQPPVPMKLRHLK